MLNRFKFGVIAVLLVVGVVALIPLFFKDVGGKFDFWRKQGQVAVSAAANSSGDSGALGTYGDKTVSRNDLNSSEKLKLFEAETQVYNAVEDIVVQRYINGFFEDFQKKNNLPDSFAAQREYFKDKVSVSEEEIKKLLDENKDNPNLQRIPEAERVNQVRQYLEGNARRTALRDFVDAARRRGDIKMTMPRPVEPRLEVADGGNASYGPVDAKVTIVEFADYQCPFCARMVPTLREVVKKYEGKVRWVYRDFPLREIHPEAMPAALAAQCAGDQGKYYEMHDKLFENYQQLNAALYTRLGTELGLDMNKYNECIKSGKHNDEIMRDYADGSQLGVNGTPSYFINGRKMGNGGDIKEFSRIIDEELARM